MVANVSSTLKNSVSSFSTDVTPAGPNHVLATVAQQPANGVSAKQRCLARGAYRQAALTIARPLLWPEAQPGCSPCSRAPRRCPADNPECPRRMSCPWQRSVRSRGVGAVTKWPGYTERATIQDRRAEPQQRTHRSTRAEAANYPRFRSQTLSLIHI